MKIWILTLIILSSFALEISAQKTTQWASRVVRYSSQLEDEFYAAKPSVFEKAWEVGEKKALEYRCD